jgi:maltokinase
MNEIDLSKLAEYLKAQRWFGRKAFPIKSVRVVDHVRLPVPAVAPASLAVLEVAYTGVPAELYLLPAQVGKGGEPQDALSSDEVVDTLVGLIRDERGITASATLKGERLPGAERALAALGSGTPVRRLSVEQSNTSLVLGDRAILKVLRKLEPGLNPEYEVGRFLASRTDFQFAPALLGALHLEGVTQTTVATLHQFASGANDGWRYVVERFRAPGTLEGRFKDELRALGRRVAELHRALASDAKDPAFAPEPVQLEDLQRWSAGMVGEISVTLAEATKMFPDLFEKRGPVVKRAQHLAHLTPSGKKIRVHGDLHLGQVLRTKDEWLVFDFEGEPSRSLAQRREKYSPLKDVAGMLRSFSYAGAAVELEGSPRTDRVPKARAAFLDGYLAEIQGSGLLPDKDEDVLGLLHGMELEKLLYEIRYEVNNRPDWAKIPVEALLNPGEVGGA